MKVMTKEIFLMDFIAFIAAIVVLRLIRYVITGIFCTVEDTLLEYFSKNTVIIKNFFSKIDFLVNKMRILSIRWHILLAFLYVAYIQLHLLHKI